MKKVVVKANTSSKLEMDRTYDALCSLANAIEDMSGTNQDLFEAITGISVQAVLDAKYDMWHQMYNKQEK